MTIFIRLEKTYTGVASGMKVILPGLYSGKDLPGGLAAYLIKTEQADEITQRLYEDSEIAELEPEVEPVTELELASNPETEDGGYGFESWSNADIEEYAMQNGINLGGVKKKAAMIKIIAQWVEETADDEHVGYKEASTEES